MLNYKVKCPFCGEVLESGKPKAVYSGKLFQCNGKNCLPGKVVVAWTPHESIVSLGNSDFEAMKDELDFEFSCERSNCLRTSLTVSPDVILEKEFIPIVHKPIEKPKKTKKTTIKKEYKEGEK